MVITVRKSFRLHPTTLVCVGFGLVMVFSLITLIDNHYILMCFCRGLENSTRFRWFASNPHDKNEQQWGMNKTEQFHRNLLFSAPLFVPLSHSERICRAISKRVCLHKKKEKKTFRRKSEKENPSVDLDIVLLQDETYTHTHTHTCQKRTKLFSVFSYTNEKQPIFIV